MIDTLQVEPHPLLDAIVFTTRFPMPLGELPTPAAIAALRAADAVTPIPAADETTRTAVRDLLRHGGYKPTGRGKPSSEYLLRAAGEGALSAINAAVDIANAVSLHSGLPISVVDLDLLAVPLHIGLANAGQRYVFNAAAQEIDVTGLLCLHDGAGACANAVKDAQRTKTHPGTLRTLSVLWGTRTLAGRTTQTSTWYRQILGELGAATDQIFPRS